MYLEDQLAPLQPGESTFIHLRLRPSSLEEPVETLQKMIYLEVSTLVDSSQRQCVSATASGTQSDARTVYLVLSVCRQKPMMPKRCFP